MELLDYDLRGAAIEKMERGRMQYGDFTDSQSMAAADYIASLTRQEQIGCHP